MKFKIKEAYLLILIVTGLISLSVYSTYALFTKEVSINNVVSFNSTISLSDSNLIEYELITLEAGASKKIELRINNSSTSNLYYGCWYEILSSDATISIGQDKDTLVNNVITTTGVINTNDTITIVIGMTNNMNSKVLVNVGVVGNTSSALGLATGRTLISDTWQDSIVVDDEYLNDHVTTTTETKNDNYTEAKMTEVTLKKGTYLLEAWGAQGGSYSTTYTGGKGGYSKGTLTLNEDTKAYIYVGGQGGAHSTTTGGTSAGGFNGGGSAKTVAYSGTTSYVTGGGGASDIRIGTDSLYARVIVAGGGSGSSNANSGYYGGGTSAGYGQSGYGATQTSAGTNGSFGQGANAVPSSTNYKYASPGGGGGWYGGGSSGTNRSDSTDYRIYTGGGSGYVYTSSTASNCPSGCLLNANYYLTDAATYAGNISFTDYNGLTVSGHSGNGAVKITGTNTTTTRSIPVINGLTTLNVTLGSTVSLEENVTHSCEDTNPNCTYIGPDITDTSSLTEGTYTIYYKIKSGNNITYKYPRTITVTNGIIVTPTTLEESKTTSEQTVKLEYTTPQKNQVTLSPGTYLLETWGAQGANTRRRGEDEDGDEYYQDASGGRGGYAKGTLTLTEDTTVYAYVGGQNGFNGGGSPFDSSDANGGGASDIRIGTDSLYARVIVAGGGGGASVLRESGDLRRYDGWDGGVECTKCGNQTFPQSLLLSTDASPTVSFGVGGNGTGYYIGAGGGGWYGGDYKEDGSAGGGSNYVFTADTEKDTPVGYLLTSKYYLTNASITPGDNSFTDFNGSSSSGHDGDGAIRISGTKKSITYSIPTISGLDGISIKVGENVNLTSNVIYKCENNTTGCTYEGPSITSTTSLAAGEHIIYYTIKDKSGQTYKYPRTINVVNGTLVTDSILSKNITTYSSSNLSTETITYDYETPGTYYIKLNPGIYQLETWGAQGANSAGSGTGKGGKGGHSVGTINLKEVTAIYANVGGRSSITGVGADTDDCGSYCGYTYDTKSVGYNGAGIPMFFTEGTARYGSYRVTGGGGGASDVRIGVNSLYARVIVAGGGSGAYSGDTSTSGQDGYDGGGTTGGGTEGATQTSAGTGGTFGSGGYESDVYAGSGGGGWYGGGSSYTGGDGITTLKRNSGGGSGYIYTAATASNYPTGCLLNSSYYLTDASTESGVQSYEGHVLITGHEFKKVYSIPYISGLTDITINQGQSYSVTSGVTYVCENNGSSCTYVGPSITSTASLTKGEHFINYIIKSSSNVTYVYARKVTVK